MNKINALFESNKERKLLSLYFCAGCPTLDGTGTVIKAMERPSSPVHRHRPQLEVRDRTRLEGRGEAQGFSRKD